MTNIFWNFFEITGSLCEQIIVFYFICKFLKHDFKTARGKLVFVSGCVFGTALVTFINYFTLYDWWLSALFIIYWFAFTLLFIKGKVLYKLLATTISCIVLMSVSNLTTGIFSIITKSNLDDLLNAQNIYRILCVLMGQLLNLYFFSLILKVSDKTVLLMKKREWILIISVFIISVFSLAMIHLALKETSLSETMSVMILLAEIGLISLNVICLYITVSLNQSNRETEELKLKEQQLLHNIQYAETVRSQYQEMRSMRHDMKQHLVAVSSLQLEGKYDTAQKYISNISKHLEQIEMFMDVGNDFVNAILNSKLSIAKSKGIEVLCNSSNEISGVDEYDLCSLIGNMLDNAIEAAEKAGSNAVVEVSILSDKYRIMITVSNSIANSVLCANSELDTTKKEPYLHGFGIKSIKAIAEKYGGNVDFYEEDLTFFSRVILGKNIG